MDNEMILCIINTLESVTLVSTEDNLSKMLAVIQVLKKALKADEQGGEKDA